MSQRVTVEQLKPYDSARLYMWDVEITGPLNSDLVNFRAVSIDQPKPNYNVTPATIRGLDKQEVGLVAWDPSSLTIIEVDTYEVIQMLWELGQKQTHNRNAVHTKKAEHRFETKLMLEDVTGSAQKIWTLYECVMGDFSPDTLNSDKSGYVNIPITIAFDFAELS